MAEGEGFEPPDELPRRLISSQVHSAKLCHPSEISKRILHDFSIKAIEKMRTIIILFLSDSIEYPG